MNYYNFIYIYSNKTFVIKLLLKILKKRKEKIKTKFPIFKKYV